ncbi:MAG: ATP-binding protein [Planctomycetes bacterium]|nr:ATP-binding protein [Planctomycetota bacterium]
MIPRLIAGHLKRAIAHFPVITITGPRQSGKTTLVRGELDNYDYVSLENPDQREFAMNDPLGFLSRFKRKVIFDEVQKVPELFSYIQTIVDESKINGQFILTGSHNFLLLQSITQSLAGRCSVLRLLPFSLAEILRRKPLDVSRLAGEPKHNKNNKKSQKQTLTDLMLKGFYPPIHDKNIPPDLWLESYYQTYIERDVRSLVNIGDIETFGRFVRLCAGRNGQIVNLSSLASDCGVTHTTAKRWISSLEASFIIFLLRPYYRNFGKRLIKSPKLYFLDSGLLCFLLGIRSSDELTTHSMRGSIFEGFVIADIYKNFSNRGVIAPLYFWRDVSGHEIDLIIDMGGNPIAAEIKSAMTIADDFFDNLYYWRSLKGNKASSLTLVYGGEETYRRRGVMVYPWYML